MLKQPLFVNCSAFRTLHPVRILDFDGCQPIFESDKLAELLAGVTDTNVFVISITGAYRTGKSFLLNLLKCYLDYFTQVSLN